MTAEDYLRYKEQENKRFFGSESLNIGEAYKAVKMARIEEREKAIEKAIKAARTVIHPMSENDDQENRIVNNFIKLLEL